MWALLRGEAEVPAKRDPWKAEVFTSRYQNGHLIAKTSLLPVGITLGNPRFRLKGYKLEHRVREAAPRGQQLADAKTDWDAFRATYRERLEGFGVDWYKRRFTGLLAEHPDKMGVVLLCYEDLAAGERCHRRVFAEWWEEKTGQKVLELGQLDVQESLTEGDHGTSQTQLSRAGDSGLAAPSVSDPLDAGPDAVGASVERAADRDRTASGGQTRPVGTRSTVQADEPKEAQ